MSEAEDAVLVALRVKGFASDATVEELSGLQGQNARRILDSLVKRSLVLERTGALPGWSLTSAGRTEAEQLLARARQDAPWLPALRDGHHAFLEVNEDLKHICTDWQQREVNGGVAPNEHDDPSYDAAILERLEIVHGAAVALLRAVELALPRFSAYRPRLESALVRLRSGDAGALTRPLSGSYHDVWMELHQDFLLTLGLERGAGDGA
jgi:hypothetical protein